MLFSSIFCHIYTNKLSSFSFSCLVSYMLFSNSLISILLAYSKDCKSWFLWLSSRIHDMQSRQLSYMQKAFLFKNIKKYIKIYKHYLIFISNYIENLRIVFCVFGIDLIRLVVFVAIRMIPLNLIKLSS